MAKFKVIGKYLKQKRLKSRLSQGHVAKAVKSTAQFISNIERGISAPSTKALRVLMGLYKLPRREVMDLFVEEYRRELNRKI